MAYSTLFTSMLLMIVLPSRPFFTFVIFAFPSFFLVYLYTLPKIARRTAA